MGSYDCLVKVSIGSLHSIGFYHPRCLLKLSEDFTSYCNTLYDHVKSFNQELLTCES